MRIRKKQGAVGWPGPQTRQIEGWAKRFGVDVVKSIAHTGSVYLDLTAEPRDPDDDDEERVSVRVADHADCYCRADYTVDPMDDQRAGVKRWLESHGSRRPAKRTLRTMARIARELSAAGWPVELPTINDCEFVHVLDRDGIVCCTVRRDSVWFAAVAPTELQTQVRALLGAKTGD
jgi:hypothetical protein